MSDSEPEHTPVVVRDNTGILLCLLLFVFISMILLSLTLVRIGNLGKRLDRLQPYTTPPPRFTGGGHRDVTYFYAP
jgi:hypothetical protein